MKFSPLENRRNKAIKADNNINGQATTFVSKKHFVNGHLMNGKIPSNYEKIFFGMGCFWGAERLFWQKEKVFVTAVGYAAGNTANPTYEEVCSGTTGHNEVVKIVFDPEKISHLNLLADFWENHDPTQGMRQGNDIGSQYRSGIYCSTKAQLETAKKSKDIFQSELYKAGLGKITTEIKLISDFFFAEDYHQQYLAKNPGGYCNLSGIGVKLEAV